MRRAAPCSRRRARGGYSGIETYAEQVAVTGALAGHDVTLLTTSRGVGRHIEKRLNGVHMSLLDLGLPEAGPTTVLAGRLWPGYVTRRLGAALARALDRHRGQFRVAHLNHPGLAPAVRPFVDRVYVAAWFYPHTPAERLVQTWRHTRGNLPRRLVLAAKSLAFYLDDQSGYRASAGVVAPTEQLARHLRSQGLTSGVCPPPVRVSSDEPSSCAAMAENTIHLLMCSGDLSHPRKNLRDAVRAVRLLARPERRISIEAIGRNAGALEAEARKLPAAVQVSFTGPLPPAQVHARMRRADAFLVPSLFEEWGYAAVESLLCGTPVVTFPVYPFGEMLRDGLGVVASDMSVERFAEAIERALLGASGEDLAAAAQERFGADAVGRRLTEIWSGKELS